MKFAYENLDVWNKAVEFAVKVIDTVDNIDTGRKHYRLLDQIEASSASVADQFIRAYFQHDNMAEAVKLATGAYR